MSRTFESKPAVRQSVPLLVGLLGCSGSGKTFSALRLATGIQEVTGGSIFVIDTESRRACHYADRFKFEHVDFKAPFGSLDYLEAIQYCVSKGAGVVVIDSLSHEHEGVGGYLMTQASEVERMAGDDMQKAERVKFSAWIKPAKYRRKLINGILQLNTNLVCCFRAKEKLKLESGKNPTALGWMPIAGEEFLYEQTACALLYPGSNGVPTWDPQMPGEKTMRKLPEQFLGMLDDGKAMSEAHGRNLARWAKGDIKVDPPAIRPLDELSAAGDTIAAQGVEALKRWWVKSISETERTLLGGNTGERMTKWKAEAAQHQPSA